MVRPTAARLLVAVLALVAMTAALASPVHAEDDPDVTSWTTASGRVVDAQQEPLDDAMVEIYEVEVEDGEIVDLGTMVERHWLDGADYTVDVPTGRALTVRAKAPGFAARWAGGTSSWSQEGTAVFEFDEDDAAPDLGTITLDAPAPTGSLRVSVVDEDDQPVTDAWVEAYGPESLEGETDDDGEISWPSAEVGDYDLWASGPGQLSGDATATVDEGEETVVQIVLVTPEPGLEIDVRNETFGGGVPEATLRITRDGSLVQNVETDEGGNVLVEDLEPGSYEIDASKDGYLPLEDPVDVEYEGGRQNESISLEVDLRCEPASANEGLTNMGFEDGLDAWTVGFEAEEVAVTGADDFVRPWEGSSMVRLGRSAADSDVEQPIGPNILCQDFVVDQDVEHFAFNVLTYDYTGFDEFRFDVAVLDATSGQTLSSYRQGAWAQGTSLKASGWRGVTLDLSKHRGKEVRFAVRAGGTRDTLYPFWVYLDSADDTRPPPVSSLVSRIKASAGSTSTDPVSGEFTTAFVNGQVSDLSFELDVACETPGVEPTSVRVGLDDEVFEATAGESGYGVTIPKEEIHAGQLTLQVSCPDEVDQLVTIGSIVLYDPSGIVTDASTQEPVVGAAVTLHKVPGWTPRTSSTDTSATSCETNESKAPGAPWSQSAPTELGEPVNAASPEILPNVNPFVTNAVGYYGWDVAEGCWYVVVEAAGYEDLVSPVVGVPSEVTDLDLALTPIPPVGGVEVSGHALVGGTLTAEPGEWSSSYEVTYQWLRDDQPISGATANTYVATAADAGKLVAVRVEASREGVEPTTTTSSAVTVVARLAAPTVSGPIQVGRTASANVPGAAGTYALSYQWLLAGKPITGATARTLAIRPTFAGKRVSVRVTGTRSGLPAQTTVSTNPVVAKAASKVTVKASGGKRRAKVRIALTQPGTSVAATSGRVAVFDGKKRVGTATIRKGKATLTVKKLKPGTRTLRVTYAGDAAYRPAAASTKVRVRR